MFRSIGKVGSSFITYEILTSELQDSVSNITWVSCNKDKGEYWFTCISFNKVKISLGYSNLRIKYGLQNVYYNRKEEVKMVTLQLRVFSIY